MVQNANICLTRVKSSLVGSVGTKNLRMSPSSSDSGSSFTIKSSRLMGAIPFLSLVQPRSVCGGGLFFMAWHDVLLCFFLKETYVCVMMGAALRTLDTALRIFTAFACVENVFCAHCADFVYVYRLVLHVVGLDREIISRWSNITVHYTALVAI